MCYIHRVLHLNVFKKIVFWRVHIYCIYLNPWTIKSFSECNLINTCKFSCVLLIISIVLGCLRVKNSHHLYHNIEYNQLHLILMHWHQVNWRCHNIVLNYLALKLFIQTYACYICSRSWFRWPYTHHRGQPSTRPGRSCYPVPCVRTRRPGHCFPLPRSLPCLACHYRTHQGTGLLVSQGQYWAL